MTYKQLFYLLLSSCFFNTHAQNTTKSYLFVGSYTGGKPDTGIYLYELNPKSGQLKKISTVNNITNPSFLTISPNGNYLYACTDTKIPNAGSVSAFLIDSINGKLVFVNKQASGGENPVYLTVHKSNKFIVNGNYTQGNVSVFTANQNGSLNPYSQLIQFKDSSINKTRQDKAHIHATIFLPNNDFIFLPDLGSDKIRIFKFDSSVTKPVILTNDYTVKTFAGSGPRHFTFHPNSKFAYCIEELSGMLSVYSYSNGILDSIQRLFSYSKKQISYASADIHISPDGLFLYTSNRGEKENTIAIFSINPTNGKLNLIGHQQTYGEHPRNFTIDPTGNFLLVANQITNNIVVFKRNLKTGLLIKTNNDIKVKNPSCLQLRNYNQR